MVYGQNGKAPDVYLSSSNQQGVDVDTRTINVATGRNANGYPVNTYDKHSAFGKQQAQKNLERYNKGSFVQNKRGKAHSNNPHASGQAAFRGQH